MPRLGANQVARVINFGGLAAAPIHLLKRHDVPADRVAVRCTPDHLAETLIICGVLVVVGVQLGVERWHLGVPEMHTVRRSQWWEVWSVSWEARHAAHCAARNVALGAASDVAQQVYRASVRGK